MTKYQGGCHCKAVRYEAETTLEQVMTCNCSHCGMKGFILNFLPTEKFTLLQGEDNLTTYQFNKHVINHTFCKTCGVQSFGYGKGPDGSDTHMLNVRCLDGVDWESMKPFHYNGKDH